MAHNDTNIRVNVGKRAQVYGEIMQGTIEDCSRHSRMFILCLIVLVEHAVTH